MDRKTYELVGPDYPGNRAEDVRDPSLAWMISFLFLIALVGPFSIVLLRKVPFFMVGKILRHASVGFTSLPQPFQNNELQNMAL